MDNVNLTDTVAGLLGEDGLEQIIHFGAALGTGEIDSLEKASSEAMRGVQRRLCLMACASTSEQLTELFVRDPDAFGEVMETVDAFIDYAKGLLEVAEAAHGRLKIAAVLGELQRT